MTTKKCVACGEEFVPSRSSQKYCPECREKGRTAEYYEHKVELNRMHAGDYTPKVFHNTCKVCGKEFVSVRVPKDICSVRCQEKRRAETAKCPGCGVFLINKGNYTGRGYCSEACKEKALINKAIANGLYFPCKVCGKMFIAYGKNACFCSSECKKINTQRKKEERRQKYEGNRPPEHEKRTCPICGKAFDVTRQARGRKYCSIACRQIAVKRRNEEAAIQKESQSVIQTRICPICKKSFDVGLHQRSKKYCSPECAEIARKRKCAELQYGTIAKKRSQIRSICFECYTCRSQCERFTSNFNAFPKGAEVIMVGSTPKVIACPKFTNPKILPTEQESITHD